MILYVNEQNEICDVDSTDDNRLVPLVINDDDNPFETWSNAKICCYKVEVSNGVVTKYSPYIDTRVINHIDKLEGNNKKNESQITTLELILTELYKLISNSTINSFFK